jgi:(1->4)-alpha-D-glucan 1-alpha-D-glucosylmutase
MDAPDWESLVQNWPNGHLKLAWTRHLLKLRTELADVFAHGDYHPLEVSGPHREHVIAFARRRGRNAAIMAVAKSFAAMSQGGRIWPRAENYDGALSLKDYSVKGTDGAVGTTEIPLSALFQHLPVAVLKARYKGALKPVRKHSRA